MAGPTSRRTFLRSAAALGTAASAGSVLTPGHLRAYARAAGPRKSNLKLGLASYTTRKLSLAETIQVMKRLRLGFICLKDVHLGRTLSADQIAKEIRAVRDAGIELYGGGVIYMRTPQQVESAFDYARAAGMKTIVGVPAHELLDSVEEKIKAYDIRVAVHNHGPEDKLYPTPESAYRRIKNRDRRFGLCIDIGHTGRCGVDPADDVIRFGDRLLDMHLKDVSAASAAGRHMELGHGVLDIPAVIGALHKIEYQNVAAFEYEENAHDPVAGLAECVGYVRGILASQ